MKYYCKPTRSGRRSVLLLFVLFTLVITACGAATEEPTSPPEPSPVPEPTEPPISYEVIVALDPNKTDIQAGDKITILLSFDPPVGVVEAKWDIVVGSGTILPPEGGTAVEFTAPENDDGNVIIKVSGQTTDGAFFEKNFTFNVLPIPTPTPLPDCEFTAQLLPPPALSHSSLVGTFTTPDRCSKDLLVGSAVTVAGTASNIPDGTFLWVFVFPRNGRYYPQCNDASIGSCGANYDGTVWGNTIYLGDPGGFPNCKERFYVILASVDANGNDFLTTEMQKHSKTGYVGFAFGELPGGIQEIARLELETAGSTTSCP